jgi:hypothetical protein
LNHSNPRFFELYGEALFLLTAVGLTSLAWVVFGHWNLGNPSSSGETYLYFQGFKWDSLHTILSQIRSPGYPLFLIICHDVLGGTGVVPLMQGLAILLGISFWCHELKPYLPMAARAGVFLTCCASIPMSYINCMQSDAMGFALSLMAIASFLRAQRSGWSPRYTLLLALFTFLALMVRPSSIYLYPAFASVLIVLLGFHYRKTLISVMILAAPLFLFLALRYIVTGDLGVVSFAGFSLSGIAVQFLEPGHLESLPNHLLQMGNWIIEKRETMNFHPSHPDYFDQIKYHVVKPFWDERNDLSWLDFNAQLMVLSKTVILASPMSYLDVIKGHLSYLWIGFHYHTPMAFLFRYGLGFLLVIKCWFGWPKLCWNWEIWLPITLTLACLFFSNLITCLVIAPLSRYLMFYNAPFCCLWIGYIIFWLFHITKATETTLKPLVIIIIGTGASALLWIVLFYPPVRSTLKGTLYNPTVLLFPIIVVSALRLGVYIYSKSIKKTL